MTTGLLGKVLCRSASFECCIAHSPHVFQMAEDADFYYVVHQLLKLPLKNNLTKFVKLKSNFHFSRYEFQCFVCSVGRVY
jgi:hypothetical protein